MCFCQRRVHGIVMNLGDVGAWKKNIYMPHFFNSPTRRNRLSLPLQHARADLKHFFDRLLETVEIVFDHA
jgi:hypothetical protein